ncbi:hypothetical protein ASD65_02635 [Microbacterium sp. Root61]|uniref:M20/M25/M40 family metallo-hydrolase n=1 Tax=Microbacterium sp. Root61 TaxID=1736570 RepID=UPI0006FD4892|nr:M20/M25/M40 family metallo-hydrolase [Microbacterium sp. Root61]KRA23433.1 hypothetical protein ASD65_02635 [Microbacterium sp. Root61]
MQEFDLAQMTRDLKALVETESPSSDFDALARGAATVSEIGTRLFGVAPVVVVNDGRPEVSWSFGAPTARTVLVLGHLDTVWPVGSLAAEPWRVEDGRAYGPGCFDMKAGLVQALHAVASVRDRDGITVLVTSDEEIGAPSSGTRIAAEAGTHRRTLVFEGSADGGRIKTARRGVSMYRVHVTGRAAHAGLEPWAGINATVELAAQVAAIAAFDQSPDGPSVTPTLAAAGSSSNTVPQNAWVDVDARCVTADQQRELHARMLALRPTLPGAGIRIDGGPRHPPLEESQTLEGYAELVEAAGRLGVPAPGTAHVGGASDGNLAAAMGSIVVDGFGAVGGNAHAPGEWVVLEEMPLRAALAAELIRGILTDRAPDGDEV